MKFSTKFVTLTVILTFHFGYINQCMASTSKLSSPKKIDLILAGGHLPICSSLNTKNCINEKFSTDNLSEISYRFDGESIENFHQSSFYLGLSDGQKTNINSLINAIYDKFTQQNVNKKDITSFLLNSILLQTYNTLSDPLYFALFDFFEVQQGDLNGHRKIEKVKFEDSINVNARHIFSTFYQQALLRAQEKGRTQPTIVVLTASSRDPFEAADFYLGVFEQFAANTIWLPLDLSLQQAIESNQCQQLELIRQSNLVFNRASIYPERTRLQYQLCRNPQQIVQTLQDADGIFFNGGDQSRTLAAFFQANGTPTSFIQAVKKSLADRKVVIAGTSAGTAVQAGNANSSHPIPMITNGDPALALTRGAFNTAAPSARCSESEQCQSIKLQPGDLTYRLAGGLGLFPFGLLDTHFSERDREVRLARFVETSNQKYGFGIDETTALTVSFDNEQQVEMQVIGENGVFIVESPTESKFSQQPKQGSLNGISHYLNAGDKLSFNKSQQSLSFELASTSASMAKANSGTFSYKRQGQWRHEVSTHCSEKHPRSWQQFKAQFEIAPSSNTAFYINSKGQCSYTLLPFTVSQLPI